MGSSCSIINDTHRDVWITHDINWEVCIGVTRGIVNLFAVGANLLALTASENGEGSRRENNRSRQWAEGNQRRSCDRIHNSRSMVSQHGPGTAAWDRDYSNGTMARKGEQGCCNSSKSLTKEDWNRIASLLEAGDEALARMLSVTRAQVEEMRSTVKKFKEKAELIRPGERYTWSGTLSLTMSVYVMNDKLQFDDRACVTGPTAGSENEYKISEYFEKLDIF